MMEGTEQLLELVKGIRKDTYEILQEGDRRIAALEAENKKLDKLLRKAQHNIATLKADLSKVSQDILNLTMAYTKLMAENAALEAELAQLRQVLKEVWGMADEDIREGTEGGFTGEIEAKVRAALKEQVK